jgi:hypothetical protein
MSIISLFDVKTWEILYELAYGLYGSVGGDKRQLPFLNSRSRSLFFDPIVISNKTSTTNQAPENNAIRSLEEVFFIQKYARCSQNEIIDCWFSLWCCCH